MILLEVEVLDKYVIAKWQHVLCIEVTSPHLVCDMYVQKWSG